MTGAEAAPARRWIAARVRGRLRAAGAVVALAAVLWALALPARADTLAGSRSTALGNVPTADTGPAGQFTAGLHVAVGDRLASFVRYQLTDDLELGLTLVSGPTGPSGPLGLLARLRLLKEQGPVPSLAMGIEGETGYVVASHRLPGPLLRLHAGVRGGNRLLAFAGVDAVLNPVTVSRPGSLPRPVVAAGVDYDGQSLGGGLTFQFGPNFAVGLGVRDRGALQVVAGVSIRSLP